MDNNPSFDELLTFFKTLADQNRLKIIGLLAQQPLSVEQLAEQINLSSSTVSHHLSRLAKAGLVSARAEGYYSIYQLEAKNLEAMAQRLLAKEALTAPPLAGDLDAYDQKVLKNYQSADHRFNKFPTQEKKMGAILRFVVKAFESGKRYQEQEVNEILKQFSDDTARLRRSLVEFGLMNREGGGRAYWRVEQEN